METLYVSVQQHSELFETLQKSFTVQQTVMSKMMLKLSKLERGGKLPLLPSPFMTHGTGVLTSLMTTNPAGLVQQTLSHQPK